MTFKVWIHGLGAAFIGGAAVSVANCAIAPETFNFGAGVQKLLASAVAAGIMSAAFYLQKSPLPDLTPDPTSTTNPK